MTSHELILLSIYFSYHNIKAELREQRRLRCRLTSSGKTKRCWSGTAAAVSASPHPHPQLCCGNEERTLHLHHCLLYGRGRLGSSRNCLWASQALEWQWLAGLKKSEEDLKVNATDACHAIDRILCLPFSWPMTVDVMPMRREG